ncbi:LAME_0C00760g1_1 [Lachancea meyersii CBS 8951]|uniref:LAME_0C00760g1_1 n=1 Tax=Lachancea meyersii CBS 8951 TaxID=1266667 RepID=A0A1G4IZE7_9SACH|nr:LAME_0C00760g1_1 [Lachancea meyersii CBS 8951]
MSKVQPLYGGAISCVIPEGFLDASILREVPDTQEVFVNSRDPNELHKYTDGLGLEESIIVDLLQRVDADSDRDALELHLQEITGLNGSNEWTVVKLDVAKQPAHYQTCVAVETAYKWGKQDEKETLVLCLALLRLEDVQTDVILSVNLPISKEPTLKELQNWTREPSQPPPDQVQSAYTLLQTMASNFKVLDQSLFV